MKNSLDNLTLAEKEGQGILKSVKQSLDTVILAAVQATSRSRRDLEVVSAAVDSDGVAAVCPHDLSAAGSFDEKDDDQFNLTGSGSVTVTLKGPVKALQISIDASSTAAPINVRINGGTDDIEISPGGHMQVHNPVPSVGITSVEIIHTTANVVQVIGLA